MFNIFKVSLSEPLSFNPIIVPLTHLINRSIILSFFPYLRDVSLSSVALGVENQQKRLCNGGTDTGLFFKTSVYSATSRIKFQPK